MGIHGLLRHLQRVTGQLGAASETTLPPALAVELGQLAERQFREQRELLDRIRNVRPTYGRRFAKENEQ